MIKVTHFLLIGALLVGALLIAQFPDAASAKDGLKLLEFDTMRGVPRPYTGGANAIRGIAGGGLPWVRIPHLRFITHNFPDTDYG